MRVELFGFGTRSNSPAITAQRRVNCMVQVRKERDRTNYAITGRPGLRRVTNLGASGTRGLWAVNTLTNPLLFVVQSDQLTALDNGGASTTLGALNTMVGNVSMADDGRYLVIVDGSFGYVYDMSLNVLTVITDGNFTTSPTTVTWQDNYFIVTSNEATRQFQLSQISPSVDPTVWPAVQINFVGAGGGKLQHGIADHNILNLFGDVYSAFWQDAGSPDFPYTQIPGSAQQYGLAAPFSIAQFDNSLAGLFQDRTGSLVVSRMSGFALSRISDADIEELLKSYSAVVDAKGYAMTVGSHPLYVLNLPSASATLVYDGAAQAWSEFESYGQNHFRGTIAASFVGEIYLGSDIDGTIYVVDPEQYEDDTEDADLREPIVMELQTKHIWNDDKYIGISHLQIDIQSGVGTISGQGANPVMDLQVSQDGGRTFYSVGYSSMGAIGEYTQRVIWNTLGAARDWVLKLVVSDPVKRVITGASCEMVGGPF